MRLDAVSLGLAALVLAGSAGAVVLVALVPGAPLHSPPSTCPQVHFVRESVAGQQVFRVDQAEPRSTLSTWVHLGSRAVEGLDAPTGFWNLHDVTRRAADRPWYEDTTPMGVVNAGDRFVVPSTVPLDVTVFSDDGRGIGGLGGCGSPELRMGIEPAPGACAMVLLDREPDEAANATVFRVASARGTWYLHELDWHLQAGEASASGNLTAITAAGAAPLRFEDAAPLGELSVSDRFVFEGDAEGLVLVDPATGRHVGSSWLCL